MLQLVIWKSKFGSVISLFKQKNRPYQRFVGNKLVLASVPVILCKFLQVHVTGGFREIQL